MNTFTLKTVAHEGSQERIAELSAQLEEAQQALRALRSREANTLPSLIEAAQEHYTLRSTEQPYRSLVEEMQDGAAILSSDGRINYCNRQLAGLLASPVENLLGSSFERFLAGADLPLFTALLRTGCGKRRVRLRAADGRTLDVYLSLSSSSSGRPERRHLVVTDLSELLDARSERDQAEKESREKDELLAMLAHELRNPLSAITAATQVLSATPHESDTAQRARAIIGRQAQLLSRLVDGLLDVGRVVTGKITLDKRTVDLGELVRRAVTALGERLGQHTLVLDIEPVRIEADVMRMEQVVSSLVGNALKYTPAGGEIRVSVGREGKEAVLRVADNGVGISRELLPRVFDMFVQGERPLDRSQGGLGVGLTLARRLVGLHQGTVSAFSEGPGRGSSFEVRLPQAPVPWSVNAVPSASPFQGSARRVLIIEDNRDAREMFKTMLALAGHDVMEAEEGVSGLEMLRKADPDVAIIDVGLPGLNGYEIVRRFRAEPGGGQGVLLVALTGYGTPEAQERSRQAGFDHHLTKPVDSETLQRLVCACATHDESVQGQRG